MRSDKLRHMPVKKKSSVFNLVLYFTAPMVFSACFLPTATVSTSVAPNVDLGVIKTLYVVRNTDDARAVYQLIESQLRTMQRQASSGSEFSKPKDMDAVVTYDARWGFDLFPDGWFLRNFVIEIRDPKTNVLLATGLYAQRAERRRAEPVVAETIDSVFKGISR